MRSLTVLPATSIILWLQVASLARGQIMVGCYQNQPDDSSGKDTKTYQDIYMSQGSCSAFCRTNNFAYAMTTEGSTCFCSNQKPQDPNKIDDAKCDKPCMGYPFEKCGATTSKSIATVLLIGSSPPSSGSTPPTGGTSNKTTSGDGTNKGAVGMGEESHAGSNGNSSGEGKELHSDSPGGTLPGSSSKGSIRLGGDGGEGESGLVSGTPSPEPPQGSRDSMGNTSNVTATTTITTTTTTSNNGQNQESLKHNDGVGKVAKETEKESANSKMQSKLPQGTSSHATPTHHVTHHPQYSFVLPSGRDGNGSTSDKDSGGSSAGAITASVVAILGLAGLFAVALVFQKRRREKLEAHASWSENMPLPSTLLSNSNSSDDEGTHHHRHHSVRRHGDYSRLTPGYHHASSSMDGSIAPSVPPGALPPPPVFHPRQNMHLHQPSYPPPPGRFNPHQFVSHGLHEPMMTERPSNNPQAIIAGQVSVGYEYCPSPGDGSDGYSYYPHPGSETHSHGHLADLPSRRGSHTSVRGQHTRESMDSIREYQ
ncbi:hypothetical protein BGZ73_003310 [Actinomortierella ambigua]|nr:hypothetical protein BGZ73_003310 [Actinomortierella ambigua]